jgi:hypothetical protein
MKSAYQTGSFFVLFISLSFFSTPAHADTIIDTLLQKTSDCIKCSFETITPYIESCKNYIDATIESAQQFSHKILLGSWKLTKKGIQTFIPDTGDVNNNDVKAAEMPVSTLLSPKGALQESVSKNSTLSVVNQRKQIIELSALLATETKLLKDQDDCLGKLASYAAQKATEQTNYDLVVANQNQSRQEFSTLITKNQALQTELNNSMLTPIAKLLHTAQNSPYAWYLSVAAKSTAASAGGYAGHALYKYFIEQYFIAKKLSKSEVSKRSKQVQFTFNEKKVAYELLMGDIKQATNDTEKQKLLAHKAIMEKEFDTIKAELAALQLNLEPDCQPQQSGLQKAASWSSYGASVVGCAYSAYAIGVAIGNWSKINDFHELETLKRSIPVAEKKTASFDPLLETGKGKLIGLEAKIKRQSTVKTTIDDKITKVTVRKAQAQQTLEKLSARAIDRQNRALITQREELRKKQPDSNKKN